MTATPDTDPLAKLREPFPPNQISKLPKETKKQIDERKADMSAGVKCAVCGSWHHRNAVHLDYVGHAALTDRLLDTDPQWSWEPAAFRDGLPAFDQTGGLWIKLTVCGVTRLGYGHAAAKPNMDPGAREKEVIGDALRNAAMRFGAALDLWHKGDLHAENDDAQPPAHSHADDEGRESVRIPPGVVKSSAQAKKDGDWERMTAEIAAARSSIELRQWAADNADSLAALPHKWKTEIRAEYEAKLHDLKGEEQAIRESEAYGSAAVA